MRLRRRYSIHARNNSGAKIHIKSLPPNELEQTKYSLESNGYTILEINDYMESY